MLTGLAELRVAGCGLMPSRNIICPGESSEGIGWLCSASTGVSVVVGRAFKKGVFSPPSKEGDLILGRKFTTLQLQNVSVMMSQHSKTWGKLSFYQMGSD